MQDLASIRVISYYFFLNAFFCFAGALGCLMDICGQDFDIRVVFVVAFVDFSVSDHSKDDIGQIGDLIFLIGFNCQNKGCVVSCKMAKQALLQCHLDGLFRHPQFVVEKAEEFVKSNLVVAGVVDDIGAIRQSYSVCV